MEMANEKVWKEKRKIRGKKTVMLPKTVNLQSETIGCDTVKKTTRKVPN